MYAVGCVPVETAWNKIGLEGGEKPSNYISCIKWDASGGGWTSVSVAEVRDASAL
jgi:hypothetical protein